jgi:hypothetical protein
MKGKEINCELELTDQELVQQKRNLDNIRDLAKEGFFTTRVEKKAVEQGFGINAAGIIYQGGGNG